MFELKVDPKDPNVELIQKAAQKIQTGATAVFPTDTVYGLGASIKSTPGVERIFAIKGRDQGKGLIALIADEADLKVICKEVSEASKALIKAFWPGPLTLVLPAREALPELMKVDKTVGVRLADHELVKALILAVGEPLATTSANISEATSAKTCREAKAALADQVDVYIDGGSALVGIESTVVDAEVYPPRIYREGAISKAAVLEALTGHGKG